MVTQHIDRLLARYFAGEMSSLDEIELDYWLSESKENELYFFELTSLYQHLGGADYPDFEQGRAFDNFKNHIKRNGRETKEVKQFFDNEPKYKKMSLWYIAGIAATVIGAVFLFNRGEAYHSVSEQGIYALANRVEASLDEGEIRWTRDGVNDTIYMTGRAEFKMNSTEAGSSIVKVEDVLVKDIGTQFVVDANVVDSIFVSVSEGEVQFYSQYEDGINLRVNESGYYLTRTKQFYKIVDKSSFQFSAVTLEEIAEQLSEAYDLPVEVREEVKGLAITVTFNDEELATVLDVLSMTLDVEVSYRGSKYLIEKR